MRGQHAGPGRAERDDAERDRAEPVRTGHAERDGTGPGDAKRGHAEHGGAERGGEMIVDRDVVAAALPGYALAAELGRGSSGVVLAAQDDAHRRVAVKVMPLAVDEDATFGVTGVLRPASAVALDAESEALLLAGLDHPHLVRVYRYIAHADLALIVMELLDGGSLRVRATTGLSLEAACAMALVTAAALEHVHARDILHRDIKPENILFTALGVPKLTDFGIAHTLRVTPRAPGPGALWGVGALGGTGAPGGTGGLGSVGGLGGVNGPGGPPGSAIGTPRYMAPEQFTLSSLSPATDVYGLGVVLYELLARRPLFLVRPATSDAWARHHLTVTPRPLAGIPEPVARVVEQALAKDPDRRPQTARSFALSLAGAMARARGPGWLTRAGIPTFLDDEVQAAATGPSTPSRTSGTNRRPDPTGDDHGLEVILDSPSPTVAGDGPGDHADDQRTLDQPTTAEPTADQPTAVQPTTVQPRAGHLTAGAPAANTNRAGGTAADPEASKDSGTDPAAAGPPMAGTVAGEASTDVLTKDQDTTAAAAADLSPVTSPVSTAGPAGPTDPVSTPGPGSTGGAVDTAGAVRTTGDAGDGTGGDVRADSASGSDPRWRAGLPPARVWALAVLALVLAVLIAVLIAMPG